MILDQLKRSGFTLVEVLIVLVVVGLIAGISLPRLSAIYSSLDIAGQRSLIRDQIEGLGYRAYIGGRPIVLEASDELAEHKKNLSCATSSRLAH